MELYELKEIIDKALICCERKLQEQPLIVLSEADFERLVSWNIMKQLGQNNYRRHQSTDYEVHTQITHYRDGVIKHNRRPDILLLTEEGMKKADNPKGFVYIDESFALELKYIRSDDANYLRKVNDDLEKRSELYSNSWLYVVVLIETENEEDYNRMKAKIEKKASKKTSYGENLFCFVMKKQKVDYDKIV